WNLRVAEILVEYGRKIRTELLIEEGNHLLGEDVLVLKMLERVVKQLVPADVVVHHIAQGVQEERAFEIHVLRRRAIDSTLRDDRRAILNLGLVPVDVLQIV